MRFGVRGLAEHVDGRPARTVAASRGRRFEWISIWDHFYAAGATVTAEGTTSGSVNLEAVAATPRCASRRAACDAAASSTASATATRGPRQHGGATMDHLSRAITMGLGGGWRQGEFAAYGIPFEPCRCASSA
jgi:hypothetical protein